MNDLISRQAAIEAMRKAKDKSELHRMLVQLPSATDTNVGGNLIDRQAALDAIKKLEKPAPTAQHLSAIFDCEDTIKALPSAQLAQNLPNTCTDAIDRQAAIDATWFEPSYTDPLNVLTEVRDRLKALPSAQPERKKGEWIPVTNGRGGFECDQCHNYAPSYQDGVEWLSGFCPNCGADMRGEL